MDLNFKDELLSKTRNKLSISKTNTLSNTNVDNIISLKEDYNKNNLNKLVSDKSNKLVSDKSNKLVSDKSNKLVSDKSNEIIIINMDNLKKDYINNTRLLQKINNSLVLYKPKQANNCYLILYIFFSMVLVIVVNNYIIFEVIHKCN